MPPTRDAGGPSEAKIISELGKVFNIDEVYGTESFIGSLKSADDFQPAEVLASGPVTSDEKMIEVCISLSYFSLIVVKRQKRTEAQRASLGLSEKSTKLALRLFGEVHNIYKINIY